METSSNYQLSEARTFGIEQRNVTSNQNDCDLMEFDIGESSAAFVDEQCAIDRPFNMNERFVTLLDQLDTSVERLRKDALCLQEKRDHLSMSIDLIKHHEILNSMEDCEREEIYYYIKRVKTRLSTVELHVRTIRDSDQEESLSQVNTMIDSLITSRDPVMSRQRCQSFLNACSASEYPLDESNEGPSTSVIFQDKKFENALLGCTLDDQKTIKKRLLALMDYLNRQIISD